MALRATETTGVKVKSWGPDPTALVDVPKGGIPETPEMAAERLASERLSQEKKKWKSKKRSKKGRHGFVPCTGPYYDPVFGPTVCVPPILEPFPSVVFAERPGMSYAMPLPPLAPSQAPSFQDPLFVHIEKTQEPPTLMDRSPSNTNLSSVKKEADEAKMYAITGIALGAVALAALVIGSIVKMYKRRNPVTGSALA